MKCEEVMEYMQRCLDMDLTDAENAAMQEHMKTCTSCAEMFERLNHLSRELVNLPKITPPYSIVDSILPRLEEIDEQATTVLAQPEPISKWREFRKSVSLRVLGGMAAAVLFVVIAVNQLPQFMGQDGSGDMAYFNSANSGDDSASGANMEPSMASESMMVKDEATSDRRSAFTMESADESAPDATPPAADAAESRGVPEGGYGISGGVQEEEPKDSADGSRHAESEEPVIDAPIMMEAPSLKDGAERSLTMDFTDQASQIVTEPVPSPAATYTAWVEQSDMGYQVVIADAASGDRLYASPVKQADSIQELAWSDSEATLAYTAVTGESSAHFTIDVALREESQLKK